MKIQVDAPGVRRFGGVRLERICHLVESNPRRGGGLAEWRAAALYYHHLWFADVVVSGRRQK